MVFVVLGATFGLLAIAAVACATRLLALRGEALDARAALEVQASLRGKGSGDPTTARPDGPVGYAQEAYGEALRRYERAAAGFPFRWIARALRVPPTLEGRG